MQKTKNRLDLIIKLHNEGESNKQIVEVKNQKV